MKQEKLLPVYDYQNNYVGTMPVSEALYHSHEGEMDLKSKGRGRQFRYTAAQWKPRANLKWRSVPSAGFSVMQLVDS